MPYVNELTEASYQSPNNQLSKTVRRALQDGTNDHDRRAYEDGFPTAQPVPDPDGWN
jgi:hypothetical protein